MEHGGGRAGANRTFSGLQASWINEGVGAADGDRRDDPVEVDDDDDDSQSILAKRTMPETRQRSEVFESFTELCAIGRARGRLSCRSRHSIRLPAYSPSSSIGTPFLHRQHHTCFIGLPTCRNWGGNASPFRSSKSRSCIPPALRAGSRHRRARTLHLPVSSAARAAFGQPRPMRGPDESD